jgi:hypothetical protein
MLREAGKPLAIKEMALAALKAKGSRYPDWRTLWPTRTPLRDTFAKLQALGMARVVGVGKTIRRALVVDDV